MSLRSLFRRYRTPLTSYDGHIIYYNWWNKQPVDEIWFSTFLHNRDYTKRFPKARFVFFSSLGNINLLRLDTLAHPFSHNRKHLYKRFACFLLTKPFCCCFSYNYHLPFFRFFRITARRQHTTPLLCDMRKLSAVFLLNFSQILTLL